VQQALTRLEGGAQDLLGFGHEYGRTSPSDDAKLVRRFMKAERREIIILRRYVLLGANTLAEQSGAGSEEMESLVAEMRAAAKPKLETKK
jgi:hypothetical protein